MEFFAQMHHSSLPAHLTTFYFQNFNDDLEENSQLMEETLQLIAKLLKIFFVKGIKLDNVKYLLQNYTPQEGLENKKEKMVMEFLNSAFSIKRNTGYFHFEAAERNGFLRIDDMNRSRPPQSDYSLVFWLYLESVDTSNGLTILQLVDESNGATMFDLSCTPDFKLKLEASNQSCVLNYQFMPFTWNHVAIIHQKPLLGPHSSKFFVNGNLIETVRNGYMGQTSMVKKVKAIVGCANSLLSNANTTVWGLGSMLLIEETVLDDSDILYMFRNSQEFSGNWQSASNVGNSISGGIKEIEQVSAVTSISSYVFSPFVLKEYLNIKEDKILLSIFAESDINFLLEEYQKEQKVADYLQKIESHAGKVINLSHCQMNASLPNLIDRRGEIIAINFENIFNGIWRLGGVNILIRLIDLSVVNSFNNYRDLIH
jgi:hypothetical protein